MVYVKDSDEEQEEHEDMLGISQAAFYHYIYKCMDAILASTDLAYKLPETEQELNEAA